MKEIAAFFAASDLLSAHRCRKGKAAANNIRTWKNFAASKNYKRPDCS